MNDYLSLKIKNLNLILITMIVLLHSYNISDNQNVIAVVKDIELSAPKITMSCIILS